MGKTTAQLTTPTGYSGIYANWSALYTAHETSTAGANPWSFQAGKHPALNYGGHDASEQFMAQRIDYDCDNDGLIEISNLEQLNAIRWDLNSNSSVDTGFGSDERSKYAAAFPLPVGDSMAAGCGLADHDGDATTAEQPVCKGYELGAEGRSSGLDFDFDTNGSGGADSDDTYWNRRRGLDAHWQRRHGQLLDWRFQRQRPRTGEPAHQQYCYQHRAVRRGGPRRPSGGRGPGQRQRNQHNGQYRRPGGGAGRDGR